MSDKKITLWQTKLHARLHDPAEKALVLLRDPAGHEGGTSKALHRDLGFQNLPVKEWLDPDNPDVLDGVLFKKGIPISMYKDVKRADWWAAAADRPQWPMEEITVTTKKGEEKTIKVAKGAQVRWTERPILIHPLTGEKLDLKKLAETDIADIKQRSLKHFSDLIIKEATDEPDWRKTLLAFWRFGPELVEKQDGGKLGFLWPLLPADTRVPDHSIWDHLDLTSAFAGAFAADNKDEAALLALSLGPVQPFIIDAARSTSDLWAGSHLLARLSWEAMRHICEELGPDAILFPRLRGIPQVDVWLRDAMGLPGKWFENCDWTKRGTDANPLFAAALPNRFVAVVPADQAERLAQDIEKKVRQWLQDTGLDVVNRLLQEAGLDDSEEQYCHQQMREQLQGFPEVHWAAIPFSLICSRNADKQTDLELSRLKEAMAPFFGGDAEATGSFLSSRAWQVLQQETQWDDNTTFWMPNPGALYPAVYDLAERALAAAKTVRPFGQLEQGGWRDSLTGEHEWLTLDKKDLEFPPGARDATRWQRIHKSKPSWAKEGEYLGALSAIKRLWPTLFTEEVEQATGQDTHRFVVSTHTMALAAQLKEWLHGGKASDKLQELLDEHKPEPVALPRRIMLENRDNRLMDQAKLLPALLDKADDLEDEQQAAEIHKVVKQTLSPDKNLEAYLEAYYAMLLMDGDRMGQILSGDENFAITYKNSFHPQIREFIRRKTAQGNDKIHDYVQEKRALSPNRHLAISAALNDFALHVVPHIVEREHAGRLIYAGGDDVFAMLPAADLLSAMRRLRDGWSGDDPECRGQDWEQIQQKVHREGKLACKNGFALLKNRLFRMMGKQATASCGAVIAHHKAPLAAVRRELQAAEQRAKREGGRNAFSITIVKRSGGALYLTDKWEVLPLLENLRDFLARKSVSRRAAYNCLLWLKDLPCKDLPCNADKDMKDMKDMEDMLARLLDYQFKRQAGETDYKNFYKEQSLARRSAKFALTAKSRKNDNSNWLDWLENFLSMAEFLAREVRSPKTSEGNES